MVVPINPLIPPPYVVAPNFTQMNLAANGALDLTV